MSFSDLPSGLVTAPPIAASDWLNTSAPITLEQLRGRIVIVYAFQMLCPSCVSHALPQAKQVHEYYANQSVSVIGLHSVFEHHDAMQAHALKAFAHEYRLHFPIAIDQSVKESPIPQTMTNYKLQGTPSLIVIDQQGTLRLNHFGHIDNLAMGDIIGSLLADQRLIQNNETSQSAISSGCNDTGCAI